MTGIANIDYRAAHVGGGLLQLAVVAWGLRAASERTAPQAGR